MRTLSATLLAAQKSASRIPYLKVEAKNTVLGVVRLDWQRLYTGAEPDYCHAAAAPSDGSLIRVRVTPPSDARKLYRQRVPSPAPGSDFSAWTYCDQYNVAAVCACSLGAELSVFWIRSDRSIYWMKSTDCGANWGTPEVIGYTPTTLVYGVAAAYKPNGDIGLFYADQATLYGVKRVGGEWGSPVAWGKTTGDLSSVAAVYAGDWDLAVTGRDSGGDYKVWSLVYGDGGEVAVGTWSALKDVASAPSGGNFEYRGVFIDKPDVYRLCYSEKFSGAESYNRPFTSHSPAGAGYLADLWREPAPFNVSGEYGLALAHNGEYCWMTCPWGVWRAPLAGQTLLLTDDVMSARLELAAGKTGFLTVELRNDDGRYATPGAGSLALLQPGCQVDVSPGLRTTSGAECSAGPGFALESYEHAISDGRATLVLRGQDGRGGLQRWLARHQFRWNRTAGEATVKDILSSVLARAGMSLHVFSESPALTAFYPDFTVNPGDDGEDVVRRLLSFVPDVLFCEGGKIYVLNPQASDASVYSYGGSHVVTEASYRSSARGANRVEVEGRDAGGNPVIYNAFAWDELYRNSDRLTRVRDVNLDTVAKAQARAEAYLRESEIRSSGGAMRIPVNCGQQLYDVIDITDSRAGLSAAKRRVLGITLVFDRRRGIYEQHLTLGAP